MHAAAVAGLDPELAWDRTPGELLEYIRAYRDRQKETAYLFYDLAGAIADACFSRRRMRPEEAFPGFIEPEHRQMGDEEIYANCLAWCQMGGEEAEHGCGTVE